MAALILSAVFLVFSACAEALEPKTESMRKRSINVSTIMPPDKGAIAGSKKALPKRGAPDMNFDSRGIPSGMGPDFGRMEKMRAKLFGGAFNSPGLNPADPTAGRNQKNKASLDRAKVLYKKGDYKEAATEADKFIKENPEHDLVPGALLVSGKSHFFAKKYKKAISIFKKVEQNYSRYPKVPEAMYLTSKSFYALGQKDVSRRIYKKFKRLHSDYKLPADIR